MGRKLITASKTRAIALSCLLVVALSAHAFCADLRRRLRIVLVTTLCILLIVNPLFGATYYAASPSNADVADCINGTGTNTCCLATAGCGSPATHTAATGDVIMVPAGSATWSSSITVPKSITIQGTATTNIALSASDFLVFDYHISDGGFQRVTTFNLSGTGAAFAIQINGKPATTNGFRIDHITSTISNNVRLVLIGTQADSFPPCQPNYGLIDHLTYTTGGSAADAIDIAGCNENWRSATALGTNQAVIVEDSSFTYTGGGYDNATVAIDSAAGAAVVFRHNTLTNIWPSQHDTGSQPSSRSVRSYEYYANTMTCAAGGSGNNCGAAFALRGGTGVIWGNSITMDVAGSGANGFNPGSTTEIYRIATAGGEPFNFTSGGQTHQVMDLAYESYRLWCSLSPANVCYSNGTSCGGALGTCTDTCTVNISTNKCLANFDGPGTGGSLGYPSRDQTGVSQDGTDASNSQTAAADPTYIWLNTDPNNSGAVITSFVSVAGLDANFIQANREFYQQGTSFTGATGIGVGLASARPSNCTAGANGPGVGWWETDHTQLDKCTGLNTWTSGVYVPYTYPDPLQGVTTTNSAPAAPFFAMNGAFNPRTELAPHVPNF